MSISLNDSVSINYMGDTALMNNPLYLKWSQLTVEQINSAAAALKTDLKGVTANKDNLVIISYLATLLRINGLL